MRKNSINLFFCGILLLLLGCTASKKTKDSNPKGDSKFSQWLSYSKTKEGIAFSIKDPDGKLPIKRIFCSSQPDKVNHQKHPGEIIDIRNLKIAANAATHVGMLVELNARDNIGAVSMGKYIYDTQLKLRYEQGKVLELGNNAVPFESLADKNIKAWISGGMEPLDEKTNERFASLGIHWLPNYDWREAHPLGKAEWILLFGALTHQFDKAMTIFQGICERYKKYETLPKGNACKKVLVGNFAGEFWYSPLQNSFQAQFLNQVDFCTFSMRYKGSGSMAVGAERIYLEAQACNLWLNPGFPSKLQILNASPKANQLFPFNHGKIYCYSHDLNKFWEQSALKPDVVLSDLIQIKYGHLDNRKLYFYQEVK